MAALSRKSTKSSITSMGSEEDSQKLISTLSASQIAEFKEAFDLFDVNGQGSIGFSELQTCLTKMGFAPDPTEIRNMIDEVDESGRGELDFNAFCELMARRMQDDDDEDEVIAKQFRIFDRDQDGFVGPVEMFVVFQELGAPLTFDEVEEIISRADVDNDGKLGYEDFEKVMKGLTVNGLLKGQGQ
ncbi:uncharacterized protein LOC134855993 [Symsagittifera roscoffensis]|uniref:uncharacterized protein LOC134855993 n=1 Tax=Symsagittifera roscoffensis TaxID=84072 RepID=UPI00307C4DC2